MNHAHHKARLSIGFILAPKFTLSAFANFVDVLRLAADEGDRSRPILCNWSVISSRMLPIKSSCGVEIQPNEKLGNPKLFDYIVVVGGLIDEIPNLNPAYENYLHEAAKANIPLVGVCTGAFILHKAGLMEGCRCCVSWFHHQDFLKAFDGLTPVSDQIFVVDRDRITCSGGASSAHLAAYLVDRHVGRSQARKSLNIMIIDDQLDADKPQPGMPLEMQTDNEIVRKVLLHMQQTINTPLSIAALSDRLGLGRRQLERRFRTALAMTPSRAYRIIRLEYAEHLLKTTQKSLSEIAVETGFCDTSHFIRIFKIRHNITPRQMREQSVGTQ